VHCPDVEIAYFANRLSFHIASRMISCCGEGRLNGAHFYPQPQQRAAS